MQNTNTFQVNSSYNNLITLNVTPGHFATSSSHINCYIDMTDLKCRRNAAKEVAKALAQEYIATTEIDTIVCMDDTNVIGAYFAEELLSAGNISANINNAAYIITPEQHSGGQLIFRENHLDMIRDKNILVLLATATTGKTVDTALKCIEYYGGNVVGVSSIFSAAKEIHGFPVNSIFSTDDILNYSTHSSSDCPMCKAGQPINAIVNSHGYSTL